MNTVFKKRTILRLVFFILTTFLLHGLFAQTKPITLDVSYYRFENIDSLNKYSLDSIAGELQYYGINNDSIFGLIFPIVIFKTPDVWTKDNSFRFNNADSSSVKYLETKGKLLYFNGGIFSNLKFYGRDRMNFERRIYIDSTLRVSIDIKKDSVWINDKLFKKDRTGRIFQSFTGY